MLLTLRLTNNNKFNEIAHKNAVSFAKSAKNKMAKSNLKSCSFYFIFFLLQFQYQFSSCQQQILYASTLIFVTKNTSICS